MRRAAQPCAVACQANSGLSARSSSPHPMAQRNLRGPTSGATAVRVAPHFVTGRADYRSVEAGCRAAIAGRTREPGRSTPRRICGWWRIRTSEGRSRLLYRQFPLSARATTRVLPYAETHRAGYAGPPCWALGPRWSSVRIATGRSADCPMSDARIGVRPPTIAGPHHIEDRPTSN